MNDSDPDSESEDEREVSSSSYELSGPVLPPKFMQHSTAKAPRERTSYEASSSSDGLPLEIAENGRCYIVTSLAVVENLRGKCKEEFILSFSESVHPIVPQKKNPH